MKESLTTILGVTIVTVLIWLFAEAESVKRVDLRPEIVFGTASASDRVLRLVEGQGLSLRVDVQVEGSTHAVEQAAQAALKPIQLLAGMPGVPSEPGKHVVDLREALRATGVFRDARVTVARVQPASIEIDVDAVESREVLVRVEVPGATPDGNPSVTPATATLRYPSSLAKVLPEQLSVIARVETKDLEEGRETTQTKVPLVLPAEIAFLSSVVRVDPLTADVRFKLRTRTKAVTIPSVPVQVRLAPSELNNWIVDIPEGDRFLTDVKVSGPRDLVEQIENGDVQLVAYISLSFRELEQLITTKEVSFGDLPSNLQIESAKKQIKLTITKREQKPNGGPGVPETPQGSQETQ